MTSSLSISRLARESPQAPGLVTPGHVFSFFELAQRVASAQRWLAAVGVREQTPMVAFRASSSLSTLCLTWALIDRQTPFVPLHPQWTQSDCDRALAETQAVELHAPPAFEPSAPEPLLGQSLRHQPQRTLAVVYTSGTGGKPKGARLSHGAFAAAASSSTQALAVDARDRWHLTLPLAHVGGLSVLTRCLSVGAAVATGFSKSANPSLPPPGFSAARFAAECTDTGATLTSLVPTQLQRLCQVGLRPPPALRAVLVGGAALREPLLEQALGLGWPVLRTYGLTETCAQIATDRVAALGGGLSVLPGFEVEVRNGCLAVRGPALFSGYVGGRRRGAREWFVTSDLAVVRADQTLQILGRADDMIVTGGENVHPDEVETALVETRGVRAACVFGRPSSRWGQDVCAALVVEPQFSLADCFAALRKKLARFKIPVAWVVVDSLPTGPTGKVSRRRAEIELASVCGEVDSG